MLNEYIKYQDIHFENDLKNSVSRKGLNRVAEFSQPRKFDYQGKKLNIFDDGIDLNEHLVDSPDKTFLIRVKGDSMIGAGIDDGDILLVDSSRKPKHGNIVVASINNKLAVKRLNYSYKETMLLPENDNYLPIRPKLSDKLRFWGVAIMVIKDMK
jgi:DNA polymerase V